jgi:hypothetical protein
MTTTEPAPIAGARACTHCGGAVAVEALVCPNCGRFLPAPPAAAVAPPSPPSFSAATPAPPPVDDLVRRDDFVVVSQRVELRRDSRFGRVVTALVALAVVCAGGFATWHYLAPKPPGVLYRSSEGHFAARFPHRPDSTSQSYAAAGISATWYGAIDGETNSMIFSVVLRGGIPAAAVPAFLHGVVAGIASGTVTPEGQSTSTFHGVAATTAYFSTADALDVSAMVFVSSGRGYVLVGPSGQTFLRLTASFREVP